MKQLKKIKPIIFIFLLIAIAITGVTFAYMRSTGAFENKFKTKEFKYEIEEESNQKIDVTIEEEFYDTWGTKKVSFVNNGNTSVVLRVNFNEQWSTDENGILLILSNTYKDRDLVIKEWTDEWKNDFIAGNDGWYYYKYLLKSNSSVQVLNSITKNEELLSRKSDYEQYLKSYYELDFNFEVTQADTKAVRELWGVEVSINGDNLTWKF